MGQVKQHSKPTAGHLWQGVLQANCSETHAPPHSAGEMPHVLLLASITILYKVQTRTLGAALPVPQVRAVIGQT
jgi:hypothetical protein